MRRGPWIAVAVLVILLGIAVGVGAYNAGLHQGLEDSGRAVEVVRVVDGRGFFPFGLILFPLFLFGIFALFRLAFWRGRWGGPRTGQWGPGPWKASPEMFEDWHRRQHDHGAGEHPGAGGEPASV
jgi:hypothetical protein